MIRAIFFDVGGVLVRDQGDLTLRRQKRLFGSGFSTRISRKNREQLAKGLITWSQYYRILSRTSGRVVTFNELHGTFPKHTSRYERNWKIARKLYRAGYVVGVISNAYPPRSSFALNRKLALPYPPFRPVVLSYRVHTRKPERKIFDIARKRSGFRFHEMVFFDDRSRNVRAAKRLGIKAFAYKNPRQLVRSLRRLGVKI